MLSRADKEKVVSAIKADLDKANAVFLTNLIGVSSNDAVAIRKNVREAGGKVVVTRNTLFRKATEGTDLGPLFEGLKGPHAIALSFEEAPAVAKVLKTASKDHSEVVSFKGGFFDGKTLSVEEIVALADLPSRDEMLGTLLATFNAPISAFARVMHAIGEQKDGNASAAEA